MAQAYLLICSGKRISISSKFYKVIAGSTMSDAAALRYLKKYASHRGYYFQKYDHDAADFLMKVAESLNVHLVELNYQTIKARCLVDYICQFGITPEMPPLSKKAIRVLALFKPDVYFQAKINVIHRAEAKQRNKPKANSYRPQG